MEIPQGNSREEVKLRDQIIKDFYAGWIAENPEKKMWNDALRPYKQHSHSEEWLLYFGARNRRSC